MPSFPDPAHSAGSADTEEKYNYYIPMADLLSGILFVILILLMSFAVIHYPNEESGPVIVPSKPVVTPQSEPAADARARQNQAIETERQKLLQLIAADLESAGVPASVDFARSTISFPDSIAFKAGQTGLTFVGDKYIRTLANILVRRVACYVSPGVTCPQGMEITLQGILVDVSVTSEEASRSQDIADANIVAQARALVIASTMAQAEPRLLQFRGSGGAPILSFGGSIAPPGETQSLISLSFGIRISDSGDGHLSPNAVK